MARATRGVTPLCSVMPSQMSLQEEGQGRLGALCQNSSFNTASVTCMAAAANESMACLLC